VEVGMMMMVVGVVEAVGPTEGEGEVEDEVDDDNDPPRCLGHPPIPPNYLPLEVPGALAEPLEHWASGFTTTFTYDVTRSRTIGARPGHCQCHHDQ